MIRFFSRLNVFLALVVMVSFVAVYAQKHITELTADDIRVVERAIAKQQADLSIFKADWAFLNQPTQVQPIIRRHQEVLGLQAVNAKQFGSFDNLPMRPAQVLDTDALDALFETIETGGDPIGDMLETML